MPNDLLQTHLKLLQENNFYLQSSNYFKKQQKQLLIRLLIKLLIKLQNYRERHHRIVQEQLKVKQKIQNLIDKYQKKHISISTKKKEI